MGHIKQKGPRVWSCFLTYLLFSFFLFTMSVGWDFKWCPVSRITTPLARKRLFYWISMKSRLMKAARGTSKFQNWLHLTYCRRRYMAEILPIRRKTQSNQSINQSFNQSINLITISIPLVQNLFLGWISCWLIFGMKCISVCNILHRRRLR